ncbi:hypothetical protein QYE76_066868 [Lolium multiflorum]|uniref:Uncharacterized protein n=1 Tax=Lolium multiflorum TaxID=4521 RepID=A0AAD8SD60_LOLMU|nr:hypothetical protein QYE76_066868 [Lolium multiflorum]
MASMEMFFSDFRAYAKASAAEAENLLKRVEKVKKSVEDRRTALYNRLVASYHKAKVECTDMACELEATNGQLRRLEANHIIELDSVKWVEQDKVDNLSKLLDEVDEQLRKLREEVTSKSEEEHRQAAGGDQRA